MAVVRVGKERDVTRGGDRCQPDLEPRAVSPGEREVERPDGVCHSEPVEDLGAQEKVRQQPTEVRSVVVRDERPYEGGYLPVRPAVDRDEPGADQLSPGVVVDHERPVVEVVEADRIEVHGPPVLRVAGEDAAMAVPVPGEGRETHQPDEQLVLREPVRARR